MTAGSDSAAAGAASRLGLAQLGARIMLEQLERIAKHEAGTRAGVDAEELHKMRVATRRLRVAFGVFGEALARAGVDSLPVEETKRLAAALGGVRDQDVFVEWLDAQTAGHLEGSMEALAAARLRADRLARREDARAPLLAALDGPDRTALGDALHQRLEPIASGPADGGRIKKKLRVTRGGRRLIQRARRRLRKRGATLFAPSPDELHRVRIAAKHDRYVNEFLRPAFPAADAEIGARIEAATAVQDALGDLHDAQIAEAALLDDAIRAGADGEAHAAAGIAVLAKAQRARAEAALTQFKDSWEQLR